MAVKGREQREKKVTSGSEGKMVFYTFAQLKMISYYTRRGVLDTKSQNHDALKTKSDFTVCSIQNHSFRVMQISLGSSISVTPEC